MNEKYLLACKKIESDRSYLPNISYAQLMSLVINEDGTSKYFPKRVAFAIQGSTIDSVLIDEQAAKIYQIVSTRYDDSNYSMSPMWQWDVDNSTVILVNKDGEFSFHLKENAKKCNFSAPLTDLNINDFLNQENSLSFQESKKQKKILEVKNKRTSTCTSISN